MKQSKGNGLLVHSWLKVFVFLCVFSLFAKPVFAHVRKYVWTEQYQTLPKGGREVELWTTFKVPDGNQTNANTFEYQSELEYGMTDHWTVSHYERFKTENQAGPDDATNYEGFKFETKYRFGEKGKYWLDPLLYLEWASDFRNHDNPNEIEGKLVLSKDFGKFNATYNQVMESELGSGGRTEQNYAWAANYEIFSDVRVGFEMFGNYWKPSSHKNEMSLGPTVSYEGKYFWVASGAAFGVNKHTDDVEARIIVGIPL